MALSPVDVYPSGRLVAMLGNPNAGKTSLFNILTGSKQKVANYAGVTVERVEGFLKDSKERIRILDLPGIYSFHPRSPDEKVTVEVLKGEARGEKKPDLVVCVLDALNMRRGLKLVLGAQRLGLPVIVVVNMMDLAAKHGIHVTGEALSAELGVPVVETSAVNKEGVEKLKALIEDTSKWQSYLVDRSKIPDDDLARLREILKKLGLDRIFTDDFSDAVDRVVLHPVFGPILLMAVLFFVFQAVFSWAAYPMDWIEQGFNALGELCAQYLPDGFIKSMLVDAVIGGVGGVVVFLPQILILFFFILIMEESGYLPRAAFLLDRLMGSVGLSGRSFLPLLSGYACAVPAVMAARIVGSPRDRWATIAVAPLLTCSARLPVYAVMIGAFVPNVKVWGMGLQGIVLFVLYLFGMLGALTVAWILKHTRRKEDRRMLMLELPIYHMPRLGALLQGLWQRGCIYLKKVGTIILWLTILLWVLTTFPAPPEGATGPAINYSFAGMIGRALEPIFAPIGFNWQMCVSLVPALGAREVAVSALGALYAAGTEGGDAALVPLLQQAWTIPMGLSFLAFFVFSPSCFATLAAIRREMGTWKAPAGLWLAYTVLAYVFAFVIYHIALAVTA
ncbi:MAG: Ferrous iron transporter B [Burkholderia sp.]|jgi:ferrous iron transport protein B